MRSIVVRSALCAAGVSLLGLAAGAHAATTTAATGPSTLTFTDPSGDARGGQTSMDIVGVTMTTTGKTVLVKGKKVYTPNTLVAKLTLAAPPSTLPVLNFELDGTSSGCGDMALYYDGQNLASGGFFSHCGTPDATGLDSLDWDAPTVTGSTITWTIPYSVLPREMTTKATIDNLHGYTALNEPLTGLGTSLVTFAADIDDATSDATYKVG